MDVSGLQALPVELLYEIQLYALSELLPHTSRHLHQVYKSAPPSYNAQYILCQVISRGWATASDIYTKALRYPLCSKDVLDAICRWFADLDEAQPLAATCELPRHIFRSLAPKSGSLRWKRHHQPLPFLQYLYSCPRIPTPDVNSHDGYALTRAVHARFIPLIRFLLDHGASPRHKSGLAVMVAIRQKNLSLVRMLIERVDDGPAKGDDDVHRDNRGNAKRRRLEDRVEVNQDMLKAAVKCGARDIVEYLTREKNCVPDMQTLRLMMR